MTAIQAPELGVYRGIPAETYHAWEAASNSRLSKLYRSPAHLRAYLDGDHRDTPALVLGRAAHSAILEPEDFATRYVVGPEGDRRTKAVKEKWDALIAEKGDNCILKPDDYRACEKMRDAIYAHSKAAKLLAGAGEVELSLVWESIINDGDTSGLICKGRFDRLNKTYDAIIDIKTTRDASPRAFERSIFEHGYHRQGAFYLHGAQVLNVPAKHFVIIAVEKEPPYCVGIYRVTDGAIEAGRDQIFPLLKTYAECQKTGVWPGYPEEVCDIALPQYAWGQIEDEVRESEAAA